MRAIKGKNTSPELAVRKALHAAGLRFRLHVRDLPGRPDIVLPRFRVALFVHGCFWHRHPGCRFATMPAANRPFWEAKLGGNVARDERQQQALRDLGWLPLTVWECESRNETRLSGLIGEIRNSPVRKY